MVTAKKTHWAGTNIADGDSNVRPPSSAPPVSYLRVRIVDGGTSSNTPCVADFLLHLQTELSTFSKSGPVKKC